MAAHVGRPLKGTDVKKHPVIFRRSIPRKSGGLAAPKRKPAEIRKPVPAKRAAPKAAPVARKPARRVIRTIAEFERALDLMLQGDLEYVSTAEYKSKK